MPPSTKSKVTDLALLGGAPLSADPLYVGYPHVGNTDACLERIRGVLETRRLTNDGPLVQQWEKEIADRLEVKHCIAVTNGTLGLELLIRALGLEGEVIVPSFTFVATAHALSWLGVTPVFADIDSDTHLLDPRDVERRITEKTSAILGVHAWGNPCNIDGLTELASRHNLQLAFDAAHAFGNQFQGRYLGNFGAAEVFSFHATKFINSLEGGAITTNDDSLAETLRRMRNFGFVDYDDVRTLGTNAKMNEVCAAMGLTTLDAYEEIRANNQKNTRVYRDALRGVAGVQLLEWDVEGHNCQYVVLETTDGSALDRDTVVELLHRENVMARRYFYPGCHRFAPYASRPNGSLPCTDRVSNRVLVLPNGDNVDRSLIEGIASTLRVAGENAQRIKDHLHKKQNAA